MEEMKDQALIQNEIKVFQHRDKEGHAQFMASFEINWKLEEVVALLYEHDLVSEWFRVPTGDKLNVNVRVSDSVFSAQSRVPIKWPVWDRFGSFRVVCYMEPAFNGMMMVLKSHPEEKETFFGEPLPKVPESCVRINMKKQFRYFEKVAEDRIRVILLTDIDIGLYLMPKAMQD